MELDQIKKWIDSEWEDAGCMVGMIFGVSVSELDKEYLEKLYVIQLNEKKLAEASHRKTEDLLVLGRG